MRVLAFITSVLAILEIGFAPIKNELYEIPVSVYESKNGVTTFLSADGNLWEYDDFWPTRDCYTLVLDDMGTSTIYDDEIIEITPD